MIELRLYKCGTNKIIDCPRKKTSFEPFNNCTKCDCSGTIDYGNGIVECKFEEGENDQHRPKGHKEAGQAHKR